MVTKVRTKPRIKPGPTPHVDEEMLVKRLPSIRVTEEQYEQFRQRSRRGSRKMSDQIRFELFPPTQE